MSINSGLFTSETDMWATPQSFFDKVNDEFNFETDVCASDSNHKCEHYFTEETDGLSQEWSGTCWMNPPYGREIGKWMKKAYESTIKDGGGICCLLSSSKNRYKMVA